MQGKCMMLLNNNNNNHYNLKKNNNSIIYINSSIVRSRASSNEDQVSKPIACVFLALHNILIAVCI